MAIGLGNIWRFPYMLGLYGGAAFLIVYLVVVVAVGVPALMAEMALGRRTGRGPLRAFAEAGLPGGRTWGVLLVVGVAMAMSYYLVVLGWILAFSCVAVVSLFGGAGLSTGTFASLQASVPLQLLAAAAVGAAAATVVGRGVRAGVERVSRAFLPLFGLLIVALAAWSLTLPGAGRALEFLLVPDWSALTGEAVMAAVGQAFFSLGLGGTFFVIYGSYLSADNSLPQRALSTAAGDVAAGVLAVLVVLPVVFSHDLSPASGPPLLFEVLPAAFEAMPAGGVVAVVFFLGLGCVAFLSGVAAVEVLVGSLAERNGWSRMPTAWGVVAGLVVLGLPAAWSIDYLFVSELVWGSTMQPAGSVVALVALAWGLGGRAARDEIGGTSGQPAWANVWYLWVRWVVPVAVVVVLVSGWAPVLDDLLRRFSGLLFG